MDKYSETQLRVLAPFSGVPAQRRNKRLVFMLQAYVDESIKDGELFVMAGYVSTLEKWLEFSEEWQAELDYSVRPHRPMKAFKMQARMHTRGLQRAERFYRIIEKYALCAFSVQLDISGLKAAVKKVDWPKTIKNPEALGNPYHFAFKATVESLAVVQEEYLKLVEPVKFIFDDHTSKGPCIEGWDSLKDSSSPDVQKYLSGTPGFEKDEEYLPLQSADLYAHWVRHWRINGMADGIRDLKFAWKAEKDIPRFDRQFGEEDFIHEFNRMIRVYQTGQLDKSPLIDRLNLEVNYSDDS